MTYQKGMVGLLTWAPHGIIDSLSFKVYDSMTEAEWFEYNRSLGSGETQPASMRRRVEFDYQPEGRGTVHEFVQAPDDECNILIKAFGLFRK